MKDNKDAPILLRPKGLSPPKSFLKIYSKIKRYIILIMKHKNLQPHWSHVPFIITFYLYVKRPESPHKWLLDLKFFLTNRLILASGRFSASFSCWLKPLCDVQISASRLQDIGFFLSGFLRLSCFSDNWVQSDILTVYCLLVGYQLPMIFFILRWRVLCKVIHKCSPITLFK